MKIITINLPEKYLAAIQVLVDLGISPSRSESVRLALKEFLVAELKFNADLEIDYFKMINRSMQYENSYR